MTKKTKKLSLRKSISKNKATDQNTTWLSPEDWTFRDNVKRRKANEKIGSHPSLVVGKQGKKMANLGLSTKSKRGHHANKELSRNPNPADKRKSYIRNDLQFDDEKYLRKVLDKFRKLQKQDQDMVLDIINKKRRQ